LEQSVALKMFLDFVPVIEMFLKSMPLQFLRFTPFFATAWMLEKIKLEITLSLSPTIFTA
jgi:hypothetical protein